MSDEIRLDQVVLHILDNTITLPVTSKDILDVTEEIEMYFIKHIEKILTDGNIQTAAFSYESRIQSFVNSFTDGVTDFLDFSSQVAEYLFDIMIKNIDIPPADLIIVSFYLNDIQQIGIFKLNYRTGYCHFITQNEKGAVNTIIKQKALLPLESQKIDECAIISTNDNKIKLLQNEYDINGQKEKYWSTIFLKCKSELSDNAKLKILSKTAEKITKTYFDEDFSKVATLRQEMATDILENQEVNIEEIANKVFPVESIKKEYIEEVKKAGIEEDSICIPDNIYNKKLKTHKIKTDTGIEINFPSSYFNDTSKIEFINNPDGTASIVIKNIGKIQNR